MPVIVLRREKLWWTGVILALWAVLLLGGIVQS